MIKECCTFTITKTSTAHKCNNKIDSISINSIVKLGAGNFG